jgi:hypothetical protein
MCLKIECEGEYLVLRGKATGHWRKLHIVELHYSYSSPSIIKVIKSKRMKWVGHVVYVGGIRNACRIFISEGKRSF